MKIINRKKRCKINNVKKIFIVVLFLILLILAFDYYIMPTVKVKVRDCAKTEAVYIIDKTVLEQIESQNIKYDDLVITSRNQEGQITSIETDTIALNKFKSKLSLSISQALKEIEIFKFSIKLGTLIGPDFLAETGPDIPFTVSSSDYVFTETESEFDEAGINQTAHKIILNAKVNLSCYLPGCCTTVEVKTKITIAETVIVGYVPKYTR